MSVLQNVRLNRFKILTVNSKKKKKRKIESNDYNRTSYFETISWKIANRIVNKKTHVLQLPINTDSYFSQFDSEIAILSRNSTREKFHLEFFPRIHGYCTSISHYTKKKKIYIYTHTSRRRIYGKEYGIERERVSNSWIQKEAENNDGHSRRSLTRMKLT